MANQQIHQLAAIMFTDIVGYTSMMQHDRDKAIEAVKLCETTLKEQIISYGGELLQTYGDGSLSIFESASEAVRCAMKIQDQLCNQVPLRIGLHCGEITREGEYTFGDAVNIASRIESMGVSGAVLMSDEMVNRIRNVKEFTTQNLGKFNFKNVEKPMTIYALANEGLIVPRPESMEGKGKPVDSSGHWLTSKKLVQAMVMGFLAVFLGLAIWQGISWTQGSPRDQSDKISIAVLPFENLTNDPKFEYFPASMTQELCDRLSSIGDLTVLARRACTRYKDTDLKPTEIARELKAKYLIEGSVRKAGDEIKLSSQLIDGSPESSLPLILLSGK